MRALNGMTQITDIEAVLTSDERSALGEVSEDSLFGGSADSFLTEDAGVSERGLGSIFENTADRELYSALNSDAWHYLLIRVEDDSQIRGVVRDLNAEFTRRDLKVIAYPWIDAAGRVAEMTAALRLVFNAIIIIIAIVAVIIIMNTLVISVTERIGEIGTMRAIGAQKKFVRRMIIFETLIIAFFFGGLGVLLGSLTIGIVGAANIETENLILQMLVGGPVIKPIISARSIAVSLVGMLTAGVLASLYPAVLALRIEPRQAMASR
jgi:putative ABC transport system permease protein